MWAATALQKWLELKRISALPILNDQPVLGELKSQNEDLSVVSEKILNVPLFTSDTCISDRNKQRYEQRALV